MWFFRSPLPPRPHWPPGPRRTRRKGLLRKSENRPSPFTGQLTAVSLAPLVDSPTSLATKQEKSYQDRLGIDRGILYLVLEYVEYGELFDFLVNRGLLPPHEALAYFKQIVYGLNYADIFSIVHRDPNPENIVIASLSSPSSNSNWDMAAFTPPSLQLENSYGLPHYASPGIVNSKKCSGKRNGRMELRRHPLSTSRGQSPIRRPERAHPPRQCQNRKLLIPTLPKDLEKC
jgi:serine/threonine protein kinase